MSDFHYVRTMGPEGGVDAAEGRAIGLDLEAVLDKGLPPFNIVIQIIGAVAEILAIAEEDHVVHGDLDPGDVFIDNTGAVSIEGFGHTTTLAPEGAPAGAATDRFGLGVVAYALLSPRDLPELPEGEEAHENAAIDAILSLNLEGLPEELVGDIQWYVARLLAWQPQDRPSSLEAWRAFGSMNDVIDGPPFAQWCEAALDGGGARRDSGEASRPMNRHNLGSLSDTTMSGGPMPKGAVNFEDSATGSGRSTAFWSRGDMKKAMQRALTSDYMESPDQTDWMPGTPIPPMDRQTGPSSSRWNGKAPVPRRAPGKAADRVRQMPSNDVDTDFEFRQRTPPVPDAPKPRPTRKVSTPAPTPQPAKPRRNFKPASTKPPLPPPHRSLEADPDTAPKLVERPPPTPVVEDPVPEPAAAPEPEVAAGPSRMSGPIPQADLSRGPDPFAAVEESSGPPWAMIGGVVFLAMVAIIFCLGVGGVGGVAALVGVPTGESVATNTTPKPNAGSAQAPKTPAPTVKSITPATPTPVAPAPPPRVRNPEPEVAVAPSPAPALPVPDALPVPAMPRPFTPPTVPAPRNTPAPQPARTAPVQPTPIQPAPVQPAPQPAPGVFVPTPVPEPVAMATEPRLPALPTEGIAVGDSILPFLVPEPAPNIDGSGPSQMQANMRAHLKGATDARNAVILGDARGAKAAAQKLEFINPPDALPPSWLPYVVDLKMEAWLMENSPDLPAAAFKVAQIGQSCATCHEGVRAGPVVTPAAVPEKFFAETDVMKRHAWAVDWMWVGLLANDGTAWKRGADELAGSPFPSVILQDFPDKRFMELEDKLHKAAVEGQTAVRPDQRALVFGRLLSTCARCHRVYRDKP